MIRETSYDEIFDTQRHFRTLLDSMSRPGKINRFAAVNLSPPTGLLTASAYVAFTLLNGDATYHLAGLPAEIGSYLSANTQSHAVAVEYADFHFASGAGDAGFLASAKVGQPAYPETGATVVLQVDHLGKSSSVGGLQLTLEGPGIESREIVYVAGLLPSFLDGLRARNSEFPLGVDAILTSLDGCVLCLPRTTRIRWETV